MLKQGSGPYFIGFFGDIYSVFKKNRLICVAESAVGVKETAAGLHGECLNMTVEVGDCVVGKSGRSMGKRLLTRTSAVGKS